MWTKAERKSSSRKGEFSMARASPRLALGTSAHYTSVAAYGPSAEKDASIQTRSPGCQQLQLLCQDCKWIPDFFEIVSKVRQGCIFSPFLFIIVNDFVMCRTMDKSEYGII